MTKPTQGNGGPDGRPRCFNGDRHENFLVQDGWEPGLTPWGARTRYPRMVEIPNNFSKDCKSWVADPSTDPVPLLEKWKCDGCKHFPGEAVATSVIRSLTRD